MEDFNAYDVASTRWTSKNDWKIENTVEFHHDYAIWATWKNSFNFAKFLGKKYIHFLEYDNLIDTFQYRQAFLEESRRHDVVLYEYRENSVFGLDEYCATFIFSIKTDLAVDVVDKVKNKADYFYDKPKGWQLERVFLKYVKELTNSIGLSKYIANNNELNTQAVWNRDGLLRNGEAFQVYLAAEENTTLYIHLISGFFEKKPDKEILVEVVYGNYKKFINIPVNEYVIQEIGEYRKGDTVKVYHQGVEVFREFLKDDFQRFHTLNKITFNGKCEPSVVKMNFLDGAFVEILDDNKSEYNVEFINKKTNFVEYSSKIKGNSWSKCIRQFYIDWRIKITGKDYFYEYDYNPAGRRVLISFESKSIGDTIAWIPYVEEFRKKHNCTVICSTFHNHLLKSMYPKIKFVLPGDVVHDLYALYRIGFFKKNEVWDDMKHPIDPRKEPLQKIASDILGFEYKEIRPQFTVKGVKKKQVSIAIHSTAQAKYWNNPNGWQEVVDYLKSLDYEVLLLSNEEDGYMGNFNPKGVKQVKRGPIQDLIKVIHESQLFIGISSGLSWISWATGTPTILISGFTDEDLEPQENVYRLINKNVCHGCWSRHNFDPSDWNWCPEHKDSERQFECSKTITSDDVINNINKILNHG
jgi:autotransporter strand-loop-strand O-heptosyltransferase